VIPKRVWATVQSESSDREDLATRSFSTLLFSAVKAWLCAFRSVGALFREDSFPFQWNSEESWGEGLRGNNPLCLREVMRVFSRA